MEPFDVLNVGNILDFHLEHFNLHLFQIPGPLFKSGGKNPFIEFMVLKMTGLKTGNWFQRYWQKDL